MTRTVGKLKNMDGEWTVVFDYGVQTVFADLVTELHESAGIVRMSFAAVSSNGDGIPKANVVVRLRMPKEMAWSVCRSLHALENG